VTPDFRKRLLMYYVHRFATDEVAARHMREIIRAAGQPFREGEQSSVRRRLSLKVSPTMSRNVEHLMEVSGLSKTDLLKSLVILIDQDIIKPEHPTNLAELKTLAAVASC
jgi:hypothetical protein